MDSGFFGVDYFPMKFKKDLSFAVVWMISFAGIALCACKSSRIQPVLVPGQQVMVSPPQVVRIDTGEAVFSGLRNPQAVRRFYEEMDLRLAWVRQGTLSLPGDSLLYLIRHLWYFGLKPEHYHLKALEQCLLVNENSSLARLDILLSDAFLSALHDAGSRIAAYPPDALPDSADVALLKQVIVNGGIESAVRNHEPALMQYRLLEDAMRHILDSLAGVYGDGIFTSSQLEANPAFDTIERTGLNMERWRREQHYFGNYYLLVNIPAFMLYVIEDDSVVMQSRVIVGSASRQTPELSSVIECFTTYPYWHVPRKIAIGEYLPLIRADTTFLKRNNFDVLDRNGNILNADTLEWKSFSKNNFPVSLRQREGTENALGVIKFVFDNPYGVFLHDTNAKRLFGNKVRAYSHGCVRVEKAEELAHYLIMGDLVHRSKYLETFLKQKEKHTVTLKRTMPLFVRYLTADVVDNRLLIYPDIYLKDKKMTDLLYREKAAE